MRPSFQSTRDPSSHVSFSQAVLAGISQDGGLFVPSEFPKVSIESLVGTDYRTKARVILRNFVDFSETDLVNAIERAYNSENFQAPQIVPVVKVGDVHLLELFHGRSLAFKDLALSMLPALLKNALRYTGRMAHVTVLTATSGDTGKAALEAFADVEGTSIVVFYPVDGVSPIQKLQMVTQEGSNVWVVGVRGNFDDAQSGVKRAFVDGGVLEELTRRNIFLTSANSINVGRLLPQIVYYFHGYAELVRTGALENGDRINVVVPTGNFGNILAAYYAKRMGLPIRKLICASNRNNVLTEFFRTGVYNIRRPFYVTNSPSMDILVSSNLERYLYEVSDRDSQFLRWAFERLRSEGNFAVPPTVRERMSEEFFADFLSEEETIQTISTVFREHHYLLDPHTAVAYGVYVKYTTATSDDTPTILAATAHPFKFPETVAQALELSAEPNPLELLKTLSTTLEVEIPRHLKALWGKTIRHRAVCNRDEIVKVVLKIISGSWSDDE